jgi:heat shock protein HslJ
MARFGTFGPIATLSLLLAQSVFAQSDPYRAWGIEPAWHAILFDDRIEISTRFGQASVTLPFPIIRETGTGMVVDLPTINTQLLLSDTLCRDIAVGMPHPQTAELHFNGEILFGCGGSPASLIADTKWRIEMVGDMLMPDTDPALIEFRERDTLSGTTGCNGFFGKYHVHGEGIVLDDIARTRMACPAPLDKQERAVFDALQSTRRFDFDATGRLLLIGGPNDAALMTAVPNKE